MLIWLGVMVVQSRLVEQGDIARHRRLGWIGAYLVAAFATWVYLQGIKLGGYARTSAKVVADVVGVPGRMEYLKVKAEA